MAGIADLRLFQLTALRANGTPVEGATIRILNSVNSDVTASFFDAGTPIAPVTESNGILAKLFVHPAQSLPAGVYTIQVIAAGFTTWSFTTASDFIGQGNFTANLVRPSLLDGYVVTQPPTAPMSSMIPIVAKVESPANFEWEYIRCTVANQGGKSSVIEAPVDSTGLARIDFRNRVGLGIRPLLVGFISRPDTDFSGVVDVSFSSLSAEGETSVGEGFSQSIAATLPPDGQTDLASYVALTERSWIVPSEPVIAFRGYYRDVMVWLPVPSLPGYILNTIYYDGAGAFVSGTSHELEESPFVQRIAIDTDPAATVAKCVLTITSGSDLITKPLTVLYRD